ncbi:hypothetical protein [Taibaiella soli]|uniref:Uncharacterized protein n=1 Tax=Taibaiella soli TaxID=1649169 RepID=A0A2W2ABQ6_9BACT|nr:hypothetical protein [Taibaiella soli]PZF72731.1 hypothetical protein DN068_12795 [Taibaiella soli]
MFQSRKLYPVARYGAYLIISALLFSFSACKKEKRKEILNDPAYAIGIVTKYNKANNPGSSSRGSYPSGVSYKFYLGSSTYTRSYNDGTYNVPESGVNIGDQYMVIYEKDKPKNSIMLFHYPVKDSADFNNYVSEFLTETPEF